MQRLLLATAAFGLLAASTAQAQNPIIRRGGNDVLDDEQMSLSQLTPTPSMWLYQQHKRDYLDPQLAIRRRAEYRAWQRNQRLAATRWYGYSNSRPVTAHAHWSYNSLSPYWGGGIDPYIWTGGGTRIVVEPKSTYEFR